MILIINDIIVYSNFNSNGIQFKILGAGKEEPICKVDRS